MQTMHLCIYLSICPYIYDIYPYHLSIYLIDPPLSLAIYPYLSIDLSSNRSMYLFNLSVNNPSINA